MSNHVLHEEGEVPIHIWTEEVEATALKQAHNLAKMPFIHPHGVCLMPDVHAGIGATVGSVIATEKAIIPAAVGVDIGCGMMAIQLMGAKASDLPDDLQPMFDEMYKQIPTGFERNDEHYSPMYQGMLAKSFEDINRDDPGIMKGRKNSFQELIRSQLGTLGGGNHFIELNIDESDNLWVMLHSGSRGIGNAIGQYFIERAREDMRTHFINLPDIDLAYFPEGTENFDRYVRAVAWAQDFATCNRHDMMQRVINVLHGFFPFLAFLNSGVVSCHHNYVEKENHFGRNVFVTRKGAIRARKGDLGIIPGSMGAKSYIVRGLGSEDSYCSSSHGAGRKLSRTKARELYTAEDVKQQTEGVMVLKTKAVVDEIPAAYKDIDEVMANQTDLVEIVHTLKQVMCVKGV